MSEENAFRYAEYAHPVAVKGKVRLKRLLLFSGIVLGSVIYILLTTVAVKLPQLIALLPLAIWIFLMFSWRTVSYECVCRVEDGRLSLGRTFGKTYRECFSCRVRELLYAAPDTAENEKRARALAAGAHLRDFSSGAEVPMRYLAVARVEERTLLLRFDCYEDVLRALRFYNKEAMK